MACCKRIMMKLLLIGLAVWLIIQVLKKYASSPSAPDNAKTSEASGESMVRCAVCGVHQPRSESIKSGDAFFCCEQHLQTYRTQHKS